MPAPVRLRTTPSSNGFTLFRCGGPCPAIKKARRLATPSEREGQAWWRLHLLIFHAVRDSAGVWETAFWENACGNRSDDGLLCTLWPGHRSAHHALIRVTNDGWVGADSPHSWKRWPSPTDPGPDAPSPVSGPVAAIGSSIETPTENREIA